MKLVSVIFSLVMFVVLFVAPLAQTVFQDDTSFVLQEFEDSNDAEEGETIKLKDSQENSFYLTHCANVIYMEEPDVQIQIERINHIFASNKMSVETPPPKTS